MKKTVYVVLISIFVVFALTGAALAAGQTDSSPGGGKKPTSEQVGARIDGIVKKLEQRQEAMRQKFDAIGKKIDEALKKVEEGGLDASALKADLKTLDGMVSQVDKDFSALIGKAKGLKGVDPQSDGFKSGLSDVRSGMADLKSDAREVANYFKTTIRGDVKSLRGKGQRQRQGKSQGQDVSTPIAI